MYSNQLCHVKWGDEISASLPRWINICWSVQVASPSSLLDKEVMVPCGTSVPCQLRPVVPETWPWGPVGWWQSLHDRVSRVPACKTSPRAKLESGRY